VSGWAGVCFFFCCWGYEELGFVAYDDFGVTVGHEVHNGNLLYGIWEGVASDVSPAGVPLLKDMYVGDEDAVSIPSDKYLLCMACR